MRNPDRRCWIVAPEDLSEPSEHSLRRRSSETVPVTETLLGQLPQGCLQPGTVLDLNVGFALEVVGVGTMGLLVKYLVVQ